MEEKKRRTYPCYAWILKEGYTSIGEIIDLMRKIDKEMSIPCDKIRERVKKMRSPLKKSTNHNTQ